MADTDEQATEKELQQAAADVSADEGRDAPTGDDKLGEPGKRALDAEREARKKADKENAELRARIEEFEDAQRSDEERRAREVEKLREKAAEQEQRANELQRELLVAGVAAEVGLPADMRDRLRGDTEEELRADAEKLMGLIGGKRHGFPIVPEAGAASGSLPSLSDQFATSFERAFDNA